MRSPNADRLLPDFHLLEQPITRSALPSERITEAIISGVARLDIPPGRQVAIALGSRGIDQIALVARTLVSALRQRGASVFAFPAMGSHGGATSEGQLSVLAALGLTPATVGCEFRSSMDTVQVATTATGLPVFLDAFAAQADRVVVVNRVKAHTHFRGVTESGLTKMLVIGAGKHDQAILMHAHGVAGLRDLMPVAADALIATGRIAGGVGLCEDGEHRLAKVDVIPADRIATEEAALLSEAKAMMSRLPTDEVDLLIVDELGKDISGTGMDTNVIGRVRALDFNSFDSPTVRVVYARSLTPTTQGNAIGVGLADLVHRRLVGQIDPVSTAINAMTGASPQTAAIPITVAADLEAIELFDRYLKGTRTISNMRVVRIRNTLSLDRILVSSAVIAELSDARAVPTTLGFDQNGDFTSCAGYDADATRSKG